MKADLSKLCADVLRASYTPQSGNKLKATHARELVAAFFGYKSHAALISEKTYPLDKLDEARILIPDIPLMDQRRLRLNALPDNLLDSNEIAAHLSEFLIENKYTGEEVWLYDTLESYIAEVLLIDNDGIVEDELSGVMAGTNAAFEDAPYYNSVKIVDTGDSLEITAQGTIQGTPLDDKMFCGDTIDMETRVTLYRVAGKRGFMGYNIEAGGAVNDDWRDRDMHYDVPNMRPKDQFLQMTGGLKFGETQDQLKNRMAEMHMLRNRIAKGKASARDIGRLAHLQGSDNDEIFGDSF